MMSAPFAFLSEPVQWILCACFIAATLAVAKGLGTQGQALKKSAACGIVAIEMPWDAERARQVVNRWKQDDLVGVARTQVKYDFLFLPLATSGALVAWVVLLAAPLDALENTAILKMLPGPIAPPSPRLRRLRPPPSSR